MYGNGNGINAAYASNWIIRNCEFAGWDKIIFSSHTVNALVEDNVFHDMNSHAVYYAFDQGINQGPGDFNFALDEAQITKQGRARAPHTTARSSAT